MHGSWLAAAAVLALLVAYQTVASSTARHAAEVRRARRRSDGRSPASMCSAGIAVVPLRMRGYDYLRAAFGDAWDDDNDAPGGTTAATPATTSSTAISSTRPTCRSSGVPTPSPPARCTTRTPTRPSRSSAARRSANPCRSTTSSRWPTPGTWAPAAGPPTERLRFANDPANLLAVDGQANQDKGDSQPAQWMPPNARSHASTPCSSSRCCAVTRCRWTWRRPACCVRPRRPARRGNGVTTPVVGLRVRAEPSAVVERVDRVHVLVGQLEVEHVEVRLDALRRWPTGGSRHCPAACSTGSAPARASCRTAGDRLHRRVVHQLAHASGL